MTSAAPGADEWWRAAFAEHYSEVYHHRDDAAAATEIAGLLPRLRAAPGPVLDACCGGGRHLAAMRAAGLDAYGFDFSAQLLAQALARPALAGRVVRGDVRAPPFGSGFGAITLLFTAFGYFDDAGNEAVLRGLARLLAPGGWLVLDLPDRELLAATLVPESRRRTPRGLEVVERRRLVDRHVEKEVLVIADGRTVADWRERVRLYGRDEIAAVGRAAALGGEFWPGLGGPDRDEGRLVAWFTAS